MKHFSQNFLTLNQEFDNKQETINIPKQISQTYDSKAEINFILVQQTTQNILVVEKTEKFIAKKQTSQQSNEQQAEHNRTSIDYHIQKQEFSKKYNTIKTLKQTTYYQILECFNIQNKQTVVAKIFFDKKNNEAIEELLINQTLLKNPHKNIMKLIETFEEGDKRILIYEHFSGGTLYDFLINKNLKLKEYEVKTIMKQILDILKHLHSLKIMHRDIKLDNIMFKELNNIKTIKLIDFGFSAFVSKNNISSNIKCGTPGYIAPEIFLTTSYTELCDIYSLGAVLHILATGKRIFSSKYSKLDMYKMNEKNQYRISSNLKCPLIIDLISSMLSDENSRPSAKQCLLHPFFTKLSEKLTISNQISNKMNELCFPRFKNPFVQN